MGWRKPEQLIQGRKEGSAAGTGQQVQGAAVARVVLASCNRAASRVRNCHRHPQLGAVQCLLTPLTPGREAVGRKERGEGGRGAREGEQGRAVLPGAAGHALPGNPLRTSSERSSSLALAQAPAPPLRQDLPSATLICVAAVAAVAAALRTVWSRILNTSSAA